MIADFEAWYEDLERGIDASPLGFEAVKSVNYLDRMKRIIKESHSTDPELASDIIRSIKSAMEDAEDPRNLKKDYPKHYERENKDPRMPPIERGVIITSEALDLGLCEQRLEGLFSRHPEFLESTNLFRISGKRPFEDVADTEGLEEKVVKELKGAYERVTASSFIPFYICASQDLLEDHGWQDLGEGQIRLARRILRKRTNHDVTSIIVKAAKDFPDEAFVSIERVLSRFESDEDKIIGQHMFGYGLAEFILMLRFAYPALKEQIQPHTSTCGHKYLNDFEALSNAPELLFDFIHEYEKEIRTNQYDIMVHHLLPGLVQLKDSFDEDMYRTLKLLFGKVRSYRWVLPTFDAICSEFKTIRDRKILLEYLTGKVKKLQREEADKHKEFWEGKNLSNVELRESFIENITPTYVRNLCKIINEELCESFDEADECASIEIPSYKIIKRLGQGSYKKAYLCEHDEIKDMKYTLLIVDMNKISEKAKYYLDKLGRTALENCRGEANRLASFNLLRNEHLPLILSPPVFDETKGIYYWIEEHVEKKMSDVLKEEPMDVREACDPMRQVVDALAGAFRLNCFHGDLNFDNIGITQHEVKVIDWGLCSTIPQSTYEFDGREFLGYRLTRAPEVYEGAIPTEKSDIWAVGVMLYRLATGEYPFKWSFEGSREEWHRLPMEEKKKYENEIHEKVREHCRNPEEFEKSLSKFGYEPDRALQLLKSIGRGELGKRDLFSINHFYSLIVKCLSPDPEERPSPDYVATMLKEVQYPEAYFKRGNRSRMETIRPEDT